MQSGHAEAGLRRLGLPEDPPASSRTLAPPIVHGFWAARTGDKAPARRRTSASTLTSMTDVSVRSSSFYPVEVYGKGHYRGYQHVKLLES